MADEEEKLKFQGPVFSNPTKKYGLTIRSNQTKTAAKPFSSGSAAQKPLVKPCIFDEEDEDNDDTSAKEASKKPPVSLSTSSRLKKQTQIEIEKAIKEDATVFEYDAVYDELEKQKQKIDPKLKNQSKDPKYIAGIMKAAARRQMDFEKIQERKVQREREEEGDLWADKEVFVTTAYRKKMEERQKIEEEERRQEKIEELLDVRKAKNLGGFYDTMLKMRSGEFVIQEESEKQKLAEKEEEEKLEKLKELEIKKSSQQKSYRTKREESSESEEEETPIVEQDKDEKISDEEEVEEREQEKKEAETKQEKPADDKKLEIKIEIESLKQEQELEKAKQDTLKEKEERRKNMFKKRTVGEKFDQELSDYFVRKSTVLALKSYIERE